MIEWYLPSIASRELPILANGMYKQDHVIFARSQNVHNLMWRDDLQLSEVETNCMSHQRLQQLPGQKVDRSAGLPHDGKAPDQPKLLLVMQESDDGGDDDDGDGGGDDTSAASSCDVIPHRRTISNTQSASLLGVTSKNWPSTAESLCVGANIHQSCAWLLASTPAPKGERDWNTSQCIPTPMAHSVECFEGLHVLQP